MLVYLLRHGIAEDAPASGRDADRELTAEGREKLTGLLQRVGRSGLVPDVVVTSPYKRAVQTARLATQILQGPEPIVRQELLPHGSPEQLWGEIRAHAEAEHLLLAGHDPLFSRAVSYLLGAPALDVNMKKGAMVAIEINHLRAEPRGSLQWMLIPRLCV